MNQQRMRDVLDRLSRGEITAEQADRDLADAGDTVASDPVGSSARPDSGTAKPSPTPPVPQTPPTPPPPAALPTPPRSLAPLAPTAPAKPLAPVEPPAPAKPQAPLKPLAPAKPMTSAKPSASVVPPAPVVPAKASAVVPPAPLVPAKPPASVVPPAPLAPAKPPSSLASVEPLAPVDPAPPIDAGSAGRADAGASSITVRARMNGSGALTVVGEAITGPEVRGPASTQLHQDGTEFVVTSSYAAGTELAVPADADLVLEVNGSEVEVRDLTGTLDGTFNVGDITVAGRLAHGDSRIRANAGPLVLTLAAGSDVRIQLRAGSQWSVDPRITQTGPGEWIVGDGRASLVIEGNFGDLTVIGPVDE
ncbi:hypothetical protein [Microlunatus speluncae]|uniref:hypothetical protein n=1 Tax=Microlunatus speluncae TaxID=2594267 RepID=UPI0012663D00|nr:hypothetical protein [Microlunatus speluncae]